MRRLGVFSRSATMSTFSTGARDLLREAERAGELALHIVRLVWWTVAAATTYLRFNVDLELVAPALAGLAIAWVLGLFGLRGPRTFTAARYALVVLDAWLVIGLVFVS